MNSTGAAIQARHRFFSKERNPLRRHPYRTTAAITGLGLVAAVIYGDTSTNVFGVTARQRTDQQMTDFALARYATEFHDAAKAQKFSMQFLIPRDYDVNRSYDGKGIKGGFSDQNETDKRTYEIGSNCLAGTAYDISPLAARNGARYPAQAGIVPTPQNPDQIIIASGNPDKLPDLVFSGAQGSVLQSADSNTKSQLAAYGCSQTLSVTYF